MRKGLGVHEVGAIGCQISSEKIFCIPVRIENRCLTLGIKAMLSFKSHASRWPVSDDALLGLKPSWSQRSPK